MVADASDFMDDPLAGIAACLADAQNDMGYAEQYADELGLRGVHSAVRAAWRAIETAKHAYARALAARDDSPVGGAEEEN